MCLCPTTSGQRTRRGRVRTGRQVGKPGRRTSGLEPQPSPPLPADAAAGTVAATALTTTAAAAANQLTPANCHDVPGYRKKKRRGRGRLDFLPVFEAGTGNNPASSSGCQRRHVGRARWPAFWLRGKPLGALLTSGAPCSGRTR